MLHNLEVQSFPSNIPFTIRKVDAWTWVDDFIYKNARWGWMYLQGTGYKICPATNEGYTVCEAGIASGSTSSVYSDNDLSHDVCAVPYTTSDTLVTEGRIKFSDTGLSPSVGSRGFGFYTGLSSVAMFLCCAEASADILRGWRAVVMNASGIVLNQPLSFNPLLWHTYRVEVSPSGTVFKIDGVTVASTSQRPSATTFSLTTWIDNGIYGLSGRSGQSKANINQIQYIDYIALKKN